MERWKKVVVGVVVVIVAVPLLFTATMYVFAWYYRIQAERLLACAKTLKPGITTEVEFNREMAPLMDGLRERLHGSAYDGGVMYEYYVNNSPDWVTYHLQFVWDHERNFIERYMMLSWGRFDLAASFENGVLVKLQAMEGSEDHGNLGVFADSVTIYANRPPDYAIRNLSANGEFAGYIVQSTMLADSRRPALFRQYVDVDERATPDERRKALDFQFQCFTSFRDCRDASLMLVPAPNRPEIGAVP